MKRKQESSRGKTMQGLASSVQVIIETPKGSRNKIKYDPASQKFKLSKVLPEGMMFPYDFGFVPPQKQRMETPSMYWF
jgi:inorganic pyrophosphatase